MVLILYVGIAMKYIKIILPVIAISLLIACSKSSSDEDTGYSINQGVSNPYSAVAQSDFNIKYGTATFTQSSAEKHYAIAYSNGSSAGVACAAYDASGKELIKLTFSVSSSSLLPTNVGDSVNYSSASGTVIVRYTADGSGAPTTTHSSSAMKMARSDSATVNFTIEKTSTSGYSISGISVSSPESSNTLTFLSSKFTAVVAE